MLVLTTIFIDVSNNLPKTSYMKMIDIWLLVNLLLPFMVVLMHTIMDTLREEVEQNHSIPSNKTNLERKQQARLASLRRISLFYNPALVLSFALLYWVVGLKHAAVI